MTAAAPHPNGGPSLPLDFTPVIHWLTTPGGLALVALVVVALVVAAGRGGRLDLPYEATRSLLTPAEKVFFLALRRAVGDAYPLFAKVRLGDILQIENGVSGKRRFAAFGRISSKHSDFVLCDPQTFAVVGVIELDDRSHERADRQERDRFFDAAMQKAGIPVLRVAVQRSYPPKELRDAVHQAFGT